VAAFWQRGVLRQLGRKLFWDVIHKFALVPLGLAWDDFENVFVDPAKSATTALFAYLGVQDGNCSVSVTRMDVVWRGMLEARGGTP
ncbi:hypothetical protein ACI3PL_25785, partial [Lacticaseibacillus paracasei]